MLLVYWIWTIITITFYPDTWNSCNKFNLASGLIQIHDKFPQPNRKRFLQIFWAHWISGNISDSAWNNIPFLWKIHVMHWFWSSLPTENVRFESIWWRPCNSCNLMQILLSLVYSLSQKSSVIQVFLQMSFFKNLPHSTNISWGEKIWSCHV